MPPSPASGDLNSHPERPGDLDLWPFDLRTGAECRPWHGQRSCQCRCYCDFLLWNYEQMCIPLTTWPYNLDLRPLTASHTLAVWVIICIPGLNFVALPVLKIWLIFGHNIKWHGDLWPLNLWIYRVVCNMEVRRGHWKKNVKWHCITQKWEWYRRMCGDEGLLRDKLSCVELRRRLGIEDAAKAVHRDRLWWHGRVIKDDDWVKVCYSGGWRSQTNRYAQVNMERRCGPGYEWSTLKTEWCRASL